MLALNLMGQKWQSSGIIATDTEKGLMLVFLNAHILTRLQSQFAQK